MQLGIFAKTFRRDSLDETLGAIKRCGLRHVHFNMACMGGDPLPAAIPVETCRTVAAAFVAQELVMCGVSATFNAIHPDLDLRAELTRRACRLIERCSDLGTRVVTLCTGTRNKDDMWTDHPANQEPAAIDDLYRTLDVLLETATKCGVVMGIEPEQANVINSAARARALLDRYQSPLLKIVLDYANLLHENNLADIHAVLDDACNLLGRDTIVAHAKDFPHRAGGSHAPGVGLLDWSYYLRKLRQIGFTGPLVLHGFAESELPQSLRYLTATGCIPPQFDEGLSPAETVL